jgi:threonine dehydrogenase-like Zn-dependent dehydrogenase
VRARRAGVTSQCVAGGSFGNHGIDGGQGEAVRVPLAESTLVRVPGSRHPDETMRSLVTLSDVMCTGHHAAVSAGVGPGSVVGVVGDGAVGLCAVIAARRLGAARVIAFSRNPARQELAGSFGATDILAERGDAATEALLERTDGVGVDAALECVGTGQSLGTALAIARPGSIVGVVGAPHGVALPIMETVVSATSGCAAAWHRLAPTSLSSWATSSRAASIPGASSTSRSAWTAWRRPTPPWTSAARSNRCFEWERRERTVTG